MPISQEPEYAGSQTVLRETLDHISGRTFFIDINKYEISKKEKFLENIFS